jgi:hypothetical protein
MTRRLLFAAVLAAAAAQMEGYNPCMKGPAGNCAAKPADSCKDALPTLEADLVWVKPRSDKPAYQARCANRGWDLVLKIDGSRPTFRYASAHWTNYGVIAAGSTDPKAADALEAKFPSYKYMAGNEIMLERVVNGSSNFKRISTGPFRSLRHLIASSPSSTSGPINFQNSEWNIRARILGRWSSGSAHDYNGYAYKSCLGFRHIRGVGMARQVENSSFTNVTAAGITTLAMCCDNWVEYQECGGLGFIPMLVDMWPNEGTSVVYHVYVR